MINFHLLCEGAPVKRRETKNWLKRVIELENKRVGQIDIIFCSDQYLLELNKNHLSHDYYPDILTFNYSEDQAVVSGDLYISLDRVRENADRNRVATDMELKRVMVHGILHLLGYSDRSGEEKKAMRMIEESYLEIF